MFFFRILTRTYVPLKILSNLKSKLEAVSQTFNDFNYLIGLAHDALYQRENTAKVCNYRTRKFSFEKIYFSKEFNDMQRRTRSSSQIRTKSIDSDKGKNLCLQWLSCSSFLLNFSQTKNKFCSKLDNHLLKVFVLHGMRFSLIINWLSFSLHARTKILFSSIINEKNCILLNWFRAFIETNSNIRFLSWSQSSR